MGKTNEQLNRTCFLLIQARIWEKQGTLNTERLNDTIEGLKDVGLSMDRINHLLNEALRRAGEDK